MYWEADSPSCGESSPSLGFGSSAWPSDWLSASSASGAGGCSGWVGSGIGRAPPLGRRLCSPAARERPQSPWAWSRAKSLREGRLEIQASFLLSPLSFVFEVCSVICGAGGGSRWAGHPWPGRVRLGRLVRLFEFLDPLAHALASSGSFLAPNSTNTTARIKMISHGPSPPIASCK